MKNRAYIILVLLCTIVQGALAWDGSGTETSPYLIKNQSDWKQLSDDVSGGNSYSGKVFRMTVDIDVNGVSVGADGKPFSGIFDGDNHTLTYNRGTATIERVEHVDGHNAPFYLLEGATVRHLKVTGKIFTRCKFAAGIASRIDGSKATTIDDCHSNNVLSAHSDLSSDSSFGGLVGVVESSCQTGPTIKNCTFTGSFEGFVSYCGGMVGYTTIPITFENCMFDPVRLFTVQGCGTFVRTPENLACTMKECYYTLKFGQAQGEAVFNKVNVPEGCSYRMVSKADVIYNGTEYWKNGAVIELTAPENVSFNHWVTNTGGCYISNPWKRSGLQVVRDISREPSFTIETSMPEALEERTMDGTKYRYLSNRDYHLYLPQEYCNQKGYYIDNKGWLVKMVGSTKVYVTAVVGWEPNKIPSDGAQIHNDLSGYFNDYTLMACIAPQAFQGCTELKTLYFKDTDATSFDAQTNFDFIIGDNAFAYCSNLTEIKMMQYTTKGSNHWESLKASQVGYVGYDVFSNSPQAYVSVDAPQFQDYINSETWAPLWNRLTIYNHTIEEFSEYGARYGYMRNTNGDPLKNNAEGHTSIMDNIRYWNTTFKNFNAADMLAQPDYKNIWYLHITGADADYLGRSEGVMRIYNDPGEYYNYKTLCVDRNAFKGCNELKAIEFWQTMGRSSNSYSDLKMVIQNGALQGCKNLKELRMFYYAEDGDDRWITLGPKDVVPGDNIFGLPTSEEYAAMTTEEERNNCNSVPEDFKILVSTELYADFLEDPNWLPYAAYIEPVEYDPGQKNKDFQLDSLTYGYMTSAGGIMRTSQTVSQDLSWWTAARLTWEVISWTTTVKGFFDTAKEITQAAATEYAAAESAKEASIKFLLNTTNALKGTSEVAKAAAIKRMLNTMGEQGVTRTTCGIVLAGNRTFFNRLVEAGILNNGVFTGATTLGDQALVQLGMELKAKLLESAVQHTTVAAAQREIVNKLWWNSMIKSIALKPVTYTGFDALSRVAYGSWAKYKETTQGQPHMTDGMLKGMRDNILANIHQIGIAGNGMLYFTPTKNLVYHLYVKSVPDDVKDAYINVAVSSKQGHNAFAVTMNMSKTAFQNKPKLETIRFYDNCEVTSHYSTALSFTIPEDAFTGTTNLKELRLILETKDHGSYALGPENFILNSTDIFDNFDPEKFHIVIDPSRKQDFLDSESWAPLERFFKYESAAPKSIDPTRYGVKYAYAYEANSIKKEHKSQGHLVEHTIVNGADNNYLNSHAGTAILVNDIGAWDNFQLDAVRQGALSGNASLRRVMFGDLYEAVSGIGETYSNVDITLEDKCFANCPNLESVDLLYLVTDQPNFLRQLGSLHFEGDHLDGLTPEQIKIGNDVFENSPKVRLKMMPQQVERFKADPSWAKYEKLFMPCVFTTEDKGVTESLKELRYHNPTDFGPDEFKECIDLSRVLGKDGGFEWLRKRFKNDTSIESFADFKLFESLGLNYVGEQWFFQCTSLRLIDLPSTITTIGAEAFKGCSALTHIELPAAVKTLGNEAFADCSTLGTIIVRSITPPTLNGNGHFPMNGSMKIYVPDESLNAYLNHEQWKKYKDYIVGISKVKINKVVTVTEPGKLAEKLGLTVKLYDLPLKGEQMRYISGPYELYDSLTVNGPINGLDFAVLRYMAGCDSYTDNGAKTDGKLRYLNLANAHFRESGHIVARTQFLLSWDYWKIIEDDYLPNYAFLKCSQLETIILPKTLKSTGYALFRGCSNLKQIAIGGNNLKYASRALITYKLLDHTIEDLVFFTENAAVHSGSDPWGADIANVYATKDQLPQYMGQTYLTCRVHSFLAPFDDDVITKILFEKNEYFPTSYLQRKEVEGIFEGDTCLTRFDEFQKFVGVKRLVKAFQDCYKMKSITLPPYMESIGKDAFAGCISLDTIRINCDTAPTLAEDAFEGLPADFRIIVPKRLCKLYRAEWAQYADHINMDEDSYATDEILEVTVTEPNTLHKKLGFEIQTKGIVPHIVSLKGDYSKITRLKVNGPISGQDFDVLKFLAGYCPWTMSFNFGGHLEYIDLYDANIVESTYTTGHDLYKSGKPHIVYNDVMPKHALLRCRALKTLILPRTCKEIATRALQECEALENLVVGDDMQTFNWDALDDDASLTRMYIMAKKKINITSEFGVWRHLCNNYNPTFDAFYVRPSLYRAYLNDDAYTGMSWQRTNNISKGTFDDDESFCAFAKHAAATRDDLTLVTDVNGWFNSHPGAKNLSPLAYTSIRKLDYATIYPLTQLEQIALPSSLTQIDDDIFSNAPNLRSVDMLQCSPTDIIEKVRTDHFAQLGINTEKTLVYLPSAYGKSDGTNIVVENADDVELHTRHFRMEDGKDYLVPYPFKADTVTFTRKMAKDKLYSFCLPYRADLPAGAKVWEVDTRKGSTIVFKEVTDELQPLKPYLVQTLTDDVTLNSNVKQTIPSSGGMTIGQTENFFNMTAFQGTLSAVDEKTAHDLPAYLVNDTVTAMDKDFCSTGTWKAADKIQPFTAFLLPGANGTYNVKLEGSGILLLHNMANNQATINHYKDRKMNSAILLGRTLNKNGKWNTLCLPFDVVDGDADSDHPASTGGRDGKTFTGTPLEGAKVVTIDKATLESKTLKLDYSAPQQQMQAGKPYLVKWETVGTNIVEPTFNGVTINNEISPVNAGVVRTMGTYDPMVLAAGSKDILYIGVDGKFYYPGVDVTIGAHRAYLEVMVAGNYEIVTGITETYNERKEPTDCNYYDLQGRRVLHPTKGVYIINGKKVLIK